MSEREREKERERERERERAREGERDKLSKNEPLYSLSYFDLPFFYSSTKC